VPTIRAQGRCVLGRIGVFLSLIVASFQTSFAETQPSVVAAPYSVQGEVFAQRIDSKDWVPVKVGNAFRVGDTVRTGVDGQVAFKFVDGTLVRLGRHSAIRFKEVLPSGVPVVTQGNGKAYYFSRDTKNEPLIETKFVNAAIYGTELVVDVTDSHTTIDVLHGTIEAKNSSSTTRASIGERVTADGKNSLLKARLVQSDQSVQWMVTFPFLVAENDLAARDDASCESQCQTFVARVLSRHKAGESITSAISRESNDFRRSNYGRLFTAIGLWSSGDVVSARSELETISSSTSPRVSALRSVLSGFDALTRGDITAAETLAESAERLSPGLVNTALLQSYVSQASGDAEKALAIAQSTATRHPNAPQLLDREAELLLSFDRGEEAEDVLTKRINLHGSSPTTDTLAGFAAIDRKDFSRAAQLFETALQQDSSQSLSYLGQALLKARDRDYQSAKELLSKAVQLDPSVAVYRSYLGKLFFEDENTRKALHEFEAAIALDPRDPSPYLYRSFAYVANNQPIDALGDVEKSISLNDGRAVYRSRLLLDRDLAVRGAGLARAFTELGFSEAARIEAIKSIGDDYTNFSAHRLLSDSYDSILDGEANLSEKRIADILSPLSFNLFNSLGEEASLSDYNALFDKKETRKAVRVDWNSNRDRIGGQLLATGKQDTYGYLVSYEPFYMSGSRHKAYLGENTFRTAVQWEPLADDRFILDGAFKMRNSEGPDEGDYSEDVNIGSLRLGHNHRYSSSLRSLTQFEFGHDREYTSENTTRDVTLSLPNGEEPFTTDVLANESTKQRVQRTALSHQLIYTSSYLDSVTGLEAMHADNGRKEASPVLGFLDYPEEPVSGNLTSNSGESAKSGQLYEYVTLKSPGLAAFTAGLVGTSVKRDLTEVAPFDDGSDLKTAISPKAGLVLTPTTWLTARAAYFESLSRKAVLEDLTSLEPTLVGGINQRFNDLSGTESRNLGFGLDVKAPSQVYAGAQYIRRHLTESFGDVSDAATYDGESITSLPPVSRGFRDAHADSDIFRGYLYSVVSKSSVLTADSLAQWYQDTDPELASTTNTQRYRFGYKRFFGKHLSLGVQASYRDQSSTQFDDPSGFWLFDTGVSYRFSEQRGRVFARVDNILDRNFTYDQSVGIEPTLYEGRSFIVGVAYNFW
jgi:tetratricopeptide (TPR) repeat protein